jgi:hypothetical protein
MHNIRLFPGSKYSKLSFLVHLYHLQCLHGWSQESFTSLMGLLSNTLPPEAKLPVRTMCGSRTGGWSLPCVMSD